MSDVILPSGVLFGCQPRTTAQGAIFRSAAVAKIDPLPRAKWKDWDFNACIGEFYNQGRTGSCVGQGSTKCAEIATRLTGLDPGTLNGFVVYANTFSGRVSWGSGTSLEAGLKSISAFGAPRVTDEWPAVASTSNWPKDWRDRCSQNRVTEWVDFDGDSERIFALVWTWGQKYGLPSVIGASRAWGGGHCTCVSMGRIANGTAKIGGPNSWGSSWTNCGMPGMWEFSESRLGDLDRMGCWGCAVTTEPETAA